MCSSMRSRFGPAKVRHRGGCCSANPLTRRVPTASCVSTSPSSILCETLLDFADKPRVVVDDPFDRLAHDGCGIAAPLARDACELRLQLWRQAQFHWVSLARGTRSV